MPVVVHLRRPGDLVAVDPAVLLEDDGTRGRCRARRRCSTSCSRAAGSGAATGSCSTCPPPGSGRTGRRPRPCWSRRCGAGAAGGSRPPSARPRCSPPGWASLRPGLPLFLIGLLFSTDFLAPDVPEFFQNLLGNGVFLVIAWVGLWYPLDLLFFARLPLRRQRRVLDALLAMPVEVRVREAAPAG